MYVTFFLKRWLETSNKIYELLIRFLLGVFLEITSLQERGLMGQVLIHPCEKGKPPTGVCYKDFFEELSWLEAKNQDL